jgi:hypothetical protein
MIQLGVYSVQRGRSDKMQVELDVDRIKFDSFASVY